MTVSEQNIQYLLHREVVHAHTRHSGQVQEGKIVVKGVCFQLGHSEDVGCGMRDAGFGTLFGIILLESR